MGRLAYNAIALRNYPVIEGTILTSAALFVLVNLLVDVLYSYIDPRIQYQSQLVNKEAK